MGRLLRTCSGKRMSSCAQLDGYGLDLEGLQGGLEETLRQGNAALLGAEATQAAALDHLAFLQAAKDEGHLLARKGLYGIRGGKAGK